jgi:iron complex transport system ATP-binding protein
MAAPAHEPPAVACAGLAVGRGGVAVLAGVELAVRSGERVALVGANGSGKTTLLRALGGLDRPLAGSVRWAGGPLPAGAARVRTVGVLLQGEPASRFTVRELVTLGLGLDGPPSAAARRRVDDALAEARLAAMAERPCASLSGGEAQRALLARALVAGPRLVLLDEPTNHLDPAGRAMVEALLDRCRGTVAVVIASHALDVAASCDRVALLHAGRLVALGAPTAVLTPPLLAAALGVHVRRLDDPDGGPLVFRVLGPCAPGDLPRGRDDRGRSAARAACAPGDGDVPAGIARGRVAAGADGPCRGTHREVAR